MTIADAGDAGLAGGRTRPADARPGAAPGGATHDHPHAPPQQASAALILAACGIVYGDIGTSPIYALRVAVQAAATGGVPGKLEVLGAVSLILWSLAVIITLKYVTFVMRADNRGEGGILSLLAMLDPWERQAGAGTPQGRRLGLIVIGLFGAALLYGDGAITPAVSVLSAMEGLSLVTPAFTPVVVPLTLAILVALFALQRKGTARIGRWFGPIMVVWFLTIAAIGVAGIAANPTILRALDPAWGIRLLLHSPGVGMAVGGAVFLAVTGGEALYADMGHCGRPAIRAAWLRLVWPALMLNYLGQGAVILGDPETVANPFFLAAPGFLLPPLVLLSTAATIIASQAVISGVFSLTRQAAQLGFSPRVTVLQTSAHEFGQIYVPAVNWLVMAVTLVLVVAFGSSDALAAAYGIAVSTTMLITATLLYHAMVERWGWALPVALLASGGFIAVDGAFLAANLAKLHEGGWLPLAGGGIVFTGMMVWNAGIRKLRSRLDGMTEPFDTFLARLDSERILRTPGTAVFLTRTAEGVPAMITHYVRHTRTLPERVLIMTVGTVEQPRVLARDRIAHVDRLTPDIARITVQFGFMQTPNIPAALRNIGEQAGMDFSHATFFLGRESLVLHDRPNPTDRLFALLARNALRPSDYFHLPPDRLMEIGLHIRF